MSPATPEICRDCFRIFPSRPHVGRKRAVSRVFQRMAGKAQQCMQFMQTMAEWMQASASASSRPSQAVICTEVAFAPVCPCRRGPRTSKGDFYFKNGR
jgi:hypothetical protein